MILPWIPGCMAQPSSSRSSSASGGTANSADPPEITNPRPLADEVIAGLRMPDDKPLPPSPARWLSFDSGWLAAIGWYANPAAPELVGGSLSEVADQMYQFGDSE